MPRKTKKTTTVKPAAIKSCCPESTEAFAVFGVLTAIGASIWAVAALTSWCLSTPIPKTYSCYRHKIDTVVAQVTSVGRDYGAYTDISYRIVEEVSPYGFDGPQTRERTADKFNEIYEKLDDCEMFYRMLSEQEVRELKRQVSTLRDRLDDSRTEIRVLMNQKPHK